MFENSDLESIIQKRKRCLHIPVKILINCFMAKTKLDVQKGLYKPPASLFEAQIGKLWPSCVA